MRFHYLISYGMKSRTGWGEGDCEFITPKPIDSWEDIKAVKRGVLETPEAEAVGAESITVRNFKLLRVES